MRYRVKEEHGLALPVALLVVTIITILGFSAAYIVDSQTQMGNRFAGGERALYFAEAGIHKYLWHLNKNPKYYEVPEEDKGPSEARLGVNTPFEDGFYYLEIEPPTEATPVVTIRSTGWASQDPSNRRTVEVQVRKRQFVQQIYITDREETPDGQVVWWITGDHVWGPFHTNGTININGNPVFHDRVTYSGSLNIVPGSNPKFLNGEPEKVAPMVLPPSNAQIMLHALSDYRFTGRTSIMLDGNQLKIRNKNGAVQIRPLPPNGVIYVDGTSGSKWDLNAGNVFVSGTLNGRLTIAAANNIYITSRDPTNFDYGSATVTHGIRYANGNFNPKGAMTDDMLGLVAQEYVRILHYGWFGNPAYDNTDVASSEMTIHATIMALNWCFEYEDYSSGSIKSNLNIVGSVIQKYRGAVGTFDSKTGVRKTGYMKHYTHDPRLAYDSPPHFSEPVNAGWEIMTWREITGSSQ
ncbi:MAG: hypothetical protein AB1497_10855 [Bacillota bacterium]